jgi:hypothetical protein
LESQKDQFPSIGLFGDGLNFIGFLVTNKFSSQLRQILARKTGVSSAGFPFLHAEAWGQLRDGLPHLLGAGHLLWEELAQLEVEAEGQDTTEEAAKHFALSLRVVRQVIRTAAITAPPALWLATYVVRGFREVGLTQRLLENECIDPQQESGLQSDELDTDLCFLSILGILERSRSGYTVRGEMGRHILSGLQAPSGPAGLAGVWGAAFRGEILDEQSLAWLESAVTELPVRTDWVQEDHFPTLEEIGLGTRFLPVVLGLAIANRTALFKEGAELSATALNLAHLELAEGAVALLEAAGVLDHGVVTPLGARIMARGPGPFGIIEAYHPYLDQLGEILRYGRGNVHLTRAANVAASQRANSASFAKANQALDAFCQDTGFRYSVFIEHALGCGEAIRQRWAQSPDEAITFVGADLENEAVDAAIAEQAAGRLPPSMRFVRNADIGRPACLLGPLAAAGINTQGAVMIVGNGFHEVRQQTDQGMQAVFEAYCRAGLVLLFTEETALSIRDQMGTAWNTYHPAFRYTHEKSGQGLRPSELNPPDPFGAVMPMSWTDCAEKGGYVCLEAYCRKGRTIFPHPGPDGRNPTTNVTYFFVPKGIAVAQGLV